MISEARIDIRASGGGMINEARINIRASGGMINEARIDIRLYFVLTLQSKKQILNLSKKDRGEL